MELTWVFSVLGLMLRLAAIWAFASPPQGTQDLLLPRSRRQGLALDPPF